MVMIFKHKLVNALILLPLLFCFLVNCGKKGDLVRNNTKENKIQPANIDYKRVYRY